MCCNILSSWKRSSNKCGVIVCFAEYIIFPAGVEGTVKANVKSRTFTPGEAVTWYNAKFLQSSAHDSQLKNMIQ